MQVPRQPKLILVVGGFFSDELGDMKAVNPPLFGVKFSWIYMNLYKVVAPTIVINGVITYNPMVHNPSVTHSFSAIYRGPHHHHPIYNDRVEVEQLASEVRRCLAVDLFRE